MTHLPPPAALGEALLESRYFHHHAVVLLDLHQPLLPPCWINKEETLLLRTCVERGGAVRSALVIGDLDHLEYDYIITVLLNASVRDLQRYVDASNHSLLDELLDDLGETSRKIYVFCNVPQQPSHGSTMPW